MKTMKFWALLLAAVLLLSGCARSTLNPGGETETPTESAVATDGETEEIETEAKRSVWSPMSRIPCYELPANATPDEIRAMAVKAMRDELTVQWYVDKSFTYDNKNGQSMPVNAEEVYAGLPYTQSASGLFQWLLYYDAETGKMDNAVRGDIQGWLGNSCAASVIWGWYSVVSSTGGQATFTMTPANGYLPVGGYRLDTSIKSYKDHNTEEIIAENGTDAILAAYTAVREADALLSYKKDGETSGHAQMAIEPAHVEYKDGRIDPENSYIMVQDQHKGQTKTTEPFVTELDGNRVHYAGHVSLKMTFADLLADCYIPLTAAEFIGAKSYTVPSVEVIGAQDVQKPEDLKKLTVTSPYTIAYIRARIMDGDEVLAEGKKLMGSSDLFTGDAKNFNMQSFNVPVGYARKAVKGETYRIVLDVTLASGTNVTALDVSFVYGG